MSEIYEKENKIYEKTDEDKKAELIISLINAKKDLNLANKNFETAEEGLVDYYTYQIKANKAKLNYLIKEAKEKKIELSSVEKIKYEA